jgi:hypothetical protein
MDTSESTPEFDIFKRIEKLEALKPTAEDGRILGMYAVYISFIALALQRPGQARKLKDTVMADLKKLGLSAGVLERLEKDLVEICDEAEKPRK